MATPMPTPTTPTPPAGPPTPPSDVISDLRSRYSLIMATRRCGPCWMDVDRVNKHVTRRLQVPTSKPKFGVPVTNRNGYGFRRARGTRERPEDRSCKGEEPEEQPLAGVTAFSCGRGRGPSATGSAPSLQAAVLALPHQLRVLERYLPTASWSRLEPGPASSSLVRSAREPRDPSPLVSRADPWQLGDLRSPFSSPRSFTVQRAAAVDLRLARENPRWTIAGSRVSC